MFTYKYYVIYIQMRIWARPSFIDNVDFAMSISENILEAFENWTMVPYSLPKMGVLSTQDGCVICVTTILKMGVLSVLQLFSPRHLALTPVYVTIFCFDMMRHILACSNRQYLLRASFLTFFFVKIVLFKVHFKVSASRTPTRYKNSLSFSSISHLIPNLINFISQIK